MITSKGKLNASAFVSLCTAVSKQTLNLGGEREKTTNKHTNKHRHSFTVTYNRGNIITWIRTLFVLIQKEEEEERKQHIGPVADVE